MKQKINQELPEVEPEVKEAPESKKRNQKDYCGELEKKCSEGTGFNDHIDSFFAYVHGEWHGEDYKRAEDKFFSHCKPCLEMSKGSLNEEWKFEELLNDYREEITKSGFNAGYQIGLQKGIMMILKMLKMDEPGTQDLTNVVLGGIK